VTLYQAPSKPAHRKKGEGLAGDSQPPVSMQSCNPGVPMQEILATRTAPHVGKDMASTSQYMPSLAQSRQRHPRIPRHGSVGSVYPLTIAIGHCAFVNVCTLREPTSQSLSAIRPSHVGVVCGVVRLRWQDPALAVSRVFDSERSRRGPQANALRSDDTLHDKFTTPMLRSLGNPTASIAYSQEPHGPATVFI
jgi:hypothetical protein